MTEGSEDFLDGLSSSTVVKWTPSIAVDETIVVENMACRFTGSFR